MDKKNIKKYISNGIFILVLALFVFVPSAKALLLQGLMQVGLFNPDVKTEKNLTNPTADLKFKDQNGKVVTLNELKGKVVFLNFWATWCPPCLAEMPSINKLYEKHKDNKDVVFILLDADSNFEKANGYMNARKYTMPVYQMASNVPEQIFAGSLPTTIVFDKQGRLSFKHEGAANYNSKKFVEFIEKLRVSVQ
ncbi:TlpA family protein disulfide reductase [Pedobacter xixiisoli]|uniref:Thiol-disulfide isomerase or thioredoxin n=1 Tax=Pedobacter xixiisoli TaxID=1476464 RepID=A0A286ACG6_9SPHI|nr:TlpA disulfide reductase family protein [Pedobacter xixiisoli]SOD19598.1 Thiol-disulfide isomerase or thioredoxin [Pedobacter xixiisoli]